MAEMNLLEFLGPFVNVMGGIAGLTILYFVIVTWQNRKKLKRLESIEREQARAKERDAQLMRLQRSMARVLARLDRRVRR